LGLDFRYLLFFDSTAEMDVFRHLGEISVARPENPAATVEVPTSDAFPYRTLTLPFRAWGGTPPHLWWDDPEWTGTWCSSTSGQQGRG
jgi:hypothetical protein